MRKKITLDWSVGFCAGIEDVPEKRVPATVPGAVQLDWARAEGWEDYTYADNYKRYAWMEDVYWSYAAKLKVPEIKEDESLFFVCKGVDYKFQVKLKGKIIHEQEGMFTPFEIDLTGKAANDDELEILIFPAPKRKGAPKGRCEADQSVKPAVSYGWDWHPRLIPLGIWDETYLEVRPACHIKDSEVSYCLNENLDRALITAEVWLSSGRYEKIQWEFYDRNGKLVFCRECHDMSGYVRMEEDVEKPQLWWPNGQGEPVLYKSVVKLIGCNGLLLDQKESRVGFRRVQLTMHPGAWEYPDEFPKSRSNPPVTLEINGRQIFCKGSNWVNPEIFPGNITDETYRPLLRMAKEANMNILRSWGGGIINKDSFFDICDEEGIMVWQEFPLSCNNYVGTPEYLKILDQESRSIIKRLRSHACVVIWCGGNELFNAWSGMTDQSLALRLLNRNCFDLDPSRPFIMTSPLMGMKHGYYRFRYPDGRDVFQVMPTVSATAYTEFGCPGPADAEYLKKFIPPDELFPPCPGTSWEEHHAFNAWQSPDWLGLDIIEHYFGTTDSLELLVERGQWLQSEGYKCIFEEARRQKPVCSMALNWCYNEPWPTAANNSIISWRTRPKPAYYAVKAALRPVLASARIPKFSWAEGELFTPELWILNDLPDCVPAGKVKAFLQIGTEEILLIEWEYPMLESNTNMPGPVVRYCLPHKETDRIKLVLKVDGRPEMNSEYTLLYRPKEGKENENQVRRLNF